jgi:hypothetical protein
MSKQKKGMKHLHLLVGEVELKFLGQTESESTNHLKAGT